MELTSEQVHWLFGGLISSLALVLMAASVIDKRPPFIALLIPGAFVLSGIALVFDLWLHGESAPADYAAESAQHLSLGAFFAVVGAAEFVPRLLGWRSLVWRLPIVIALFVAGVVFILHQQHAMDAPMTLMIVQHRLLGSILVLSGAARLWAVVAGQEPDTDRSWLFLVLLLGIALLLYTESAEMHM